MARDASILEIKKAYKRLALRYHPDKATQDGDEAQPLFLYVSEAYGVLSDPQKRSDYNKFGKAAFEPPEYFRCDSR